MAKFPTVGEVLAERIRKYRRARGWSVRQLAEECAKQGATSLTQASLTNIERGITAGENRRGSRAVTVEEMLTLARVLNIPPVALLLPFGTSNSVEICPGVQVDPFTAVRWIDGTITEPGMFGRDFTPEMPGVDWEAYRSSLDPLRRLHEVEQARDRAWWVRWLLSCDSQVLIDQRRKTDAFWEANPDGRASYEYAAKRNRRPLPGQPITDEEYVTQWRAGLRMTYDERLKEYADALWRAADAKLELPPVPSDLYEDLLAAAEPKAVEAFWAEQEKPAQTDLVAPATARPALPPNILIYEVADDAS